MRPSNICISICAVISLFLALPTKAQDGAEKKQATHLEVSVDVLSAAQRMLSSYGQYEAALRYNMKDKYFPIIEIGLGDADKKEETTNLHYTTTAPYARLGIDMNMLKDKHDDYRVYVGIRAAYTSFKYDLSSTTAITDPVWGGEAALEVTGQSCSYLWTELVASVQARIVGPVHLGWTIRYKNRLHQSFDDAGEPWYVPGFGKRGSSRLGGSFSVIVAF